MNSRFCLLLLCSTLSFSCFAQESNQNSQSGFQDDSIVWHKNNIKVNLFPMLGGRLNIAWETSIRRFPAIDLSLEGIGVFTNREDRPKGFMAQLGHRFYSASNSEEPQHPNSGFFFMPAFKAGFTQYIGDVFVTDKMGNTTLLRKNVYKNLFIPNLNIGMKFVMYKRFSLELTAGVGYLFTNKSTEVLRDNYTPTKDPFMFGFYQYSAEKPVVGSATVRLGYVFN